MSAAPTCYGTSLVLRQPIAIPAMCPALNNSRDRSVMLSSHMNHKDISLMSHIDLADGAFH